MTTLSRGLEVEGLLPGVCRSHGHRVSCSQDQEDEGKRAGWMQSREWVEGEGVGVLECWSVGGGWL